MLFTWPVSCEVVGSVLFLAHGCIVCAVKELLAAVTITVLAQRGRLEHRGIY